VAVTDFYYKTNWYAVTGSPGPEKYKM